MNVSLPALPCRTSVPAAHRTCYPLNFRGVVGKRITASRQIAGALQHQGFHVRRQSLLDGGKHRIGTFAEALDHHVAGIVDDIDVVAKTARHPVGAGATVEQIVARIAVEHVRQRITVALQVGVALQHQILHICR